MPNALAQGVCAHGVRHLAQALGRMLDAPPEAAVADIQLDLSLDSLAAEGLFGAGAVRIRFAMTGGLGGTLSLFLAEAVATHLVARLATHARARLTDVRWLQGYYAELGNILASAFLNGAAEFLGATCLPSLPEVTIDEASRRPILSVAEIAEAQRRGGTAAWMLNLCFPGNPEVPLTLVIIPHP